VCVQVLVLFSHAPFLRQRCGANGTQRWFVTCIKAAETHFSTNKRKAVIDTALAHKEIERIVQTKNADIESMDTEMTARERKNYVRAPLALHAPLLLL